MMQRSLAGVLALGILLAGTIALELTGGVADDGGMMASTLRPAPALPSRVASLPVEADRQALVDGILARPLFATTRRPTDAPAGPAATPVGLPRLAGILVHGFSRSAIFAASGSGRPIVLQEGGHVGGYTVQSIEAGQVTLVGSGGSQVLRPAFDTRPQSAAAGLPGTGPAARAASPFASTDVLQSLRGLPGLSGTSR